MLDRSRLRDGPENGSACHAITLLCAGREFPLLVLVQGLDAHAARDRSGWDKQNL